MELRSASIWCSRKRKKYTLSQVSQVLTIIMIYEKGMSVFEESNQAPVASLQRCKWGLVIPIHITMQLI